MCIAPQYNLNVDMRRCTILCTSPPRYISLDTIVPYNSKDTRLQEIYNTNK